MPFRAEILRFENFQFIFGFRLIVEVGRANAGCGYILRIRAAVAVYPGGSDALSLIQFLLSPKRSKEKPHALFLLLLLSLFHTRLTSGRGGRTLISE